MLDMRMLPVQRGLRYILLALALFPCVHGHFFAFKNRYVQVDKLTLISPKLAKDIADRSSEQASHIVAFFFARARCLSYCAI